MVVRAELPGAELVEKGLADLAEGLETVESLLVSAGAPRLRDLGFELRSAFEDPEERLYLLLARSDPDGAHSRYNAELLRLEEAGCPRCERSSRSSSSRVGRSGACSSRGSSAGCSTSRRHSKRRRRAKTLEIRAASVAIARADRKRRTTSSLPPLTRHAPATSCHLGVAVAISSRDIDEKLLPRGR